MAARIAAAATDAVLVDLGSGGGELVGRLAADGRRHAIGIDLAAVAVERAARRFPSATWVVANADRRLPLLSGCASIVTSVHGRRNPAECARVLSATGTLLIALPAADDLQELRERMSGQAVARERANAVIDEHHADFALARRDVVREQHDLDREALLQLLQGTYRAGRASAAPRIEALDRLTVTLSADVLEFVRRTSPA
jgi:23S rRNA (guanine745-N1)-methyltransferase